MNEKPDAIQKFVNEKNRLLSGVNPIVTDGVDPALVGTAFSYYFRWYMQPMVEQLMATVAGLSIARRFSGRQVFAETDDSHRRAVMCVLLALFEQDARQGVLPPMLTEVIADKKLLSERVSQMEFNEQIDNSIADVQQLGETIESVFSASELSTSNYISSPTFDGSQDVGGADAVAIVDGILFDIRCTRKRYPMTVNNLRQMTTYVLLDYYDTYQIRSCAWYYVRQKTMIVIPVEKLISNLDTKRMRLEEHLKTWDESRYLGGDDRYLLNG
jgi:hypothetical protein